ncbi:MAG TPA: farnesyl diphosphate synthase [Oscillospiraceae bacterium]|nr:farnesyl diphosphate synthase [Oscillospiraceae bacterium]
MTFKPAEVIVEVNEALQQFLPPPTTFPTEIHRAVHYSVFAGGKRLRPLLTLAAADIFTVPRQHALPAACAIEMIHTYSLIHDDLPAMDNDDYRRGRPSNHKVFGEGMAILAGDALLTLAFETLATKASAYFPAETVVALQQELSQASGMAGMIGGQVVDIVSEGQAANAEILDYIHRHKTGALFRCCLRCGALMGQAAAAELAALTDYAEKIGLAFQIVDDILDITGEAAALGKQTGSDANKQKMTYPALYGLQQAQAKADTLLEEALLLLQPFGAAAGSLQALTLMLVQRHS